MSEDCGLNRGARVAIAAAAETSAQVLEQLAQDQDAEVRRAVASNPNTSAETLLKLAEEFPGEVVNNSIFNLLVLEHLGGYSGLYILALNPTTSAQTLAELAAVPNRSLPYYSEKNFEFHRRIRAAVASNPNTPASVLQQLFIDTVYALQHDRNRHIYVAMARNPNASPDLLNWFVTYNHNDSGDSILFQEFDLIDWLYNFGVFDDVARHPNTPNSLLAKLAIIGGESARCLARVHPNVSTAVIDIINFLENNSDDSAFPLRKQIEQRGLRDLVEYFERRNWSIFSLKAYFKI